MAFYPQALRCARIEKRQRAENYHPIHISAHEGCLRNLVIIHVGKDTPQGLFRFGEGITDFKAENLRIFNNPPSLLGYVRLWWTHRRSIGDIVFGV